MLSWLPRVSGAMAYGRPGGPATRQVEHEAWCVFAIRSGTQRQAWVCTPYASQSSPHLPLHAPCCTNPGDLTDNQLVGDGALCSKLPFRPGLVASQHCEVVAACRLQSICPTVEWQSPDHQACE